MEYLEKEVMDLFSNVHHPNQSNEQELLDGMETVFTQEDNEKLLACPDENKIKNVICSANLNAAPGEDGISMIVYKKMLGYP